MTTKQKLIECAKLDGWKGILKDPVQGHYVGYRAPENVYDGTHIQLDYDTSYDAIIPLIQKLWRKGSLDMFAFEHQVALLRGDPVRALDTLDLSPLELMDALLTAKGFEV